MALIVVGVLSDLLRVRKPFMVVGAIGAIVTLIVFLSYATHPHTGYYKLVITEVGPGGLPLARLRPVDGRLHRDGRGEEPGPGRAPAWPCGGGSSAWWWASRSSSCPW